MTKQSSGSGEKRVPLTDLARELIDGKNFAAVATLMPDGSPQVSIVWIERDGEAVVFNTAEGRVKAANVRRDPRVSITVWDAANPYRQVVIRGRAIEVTRDGSEEGIERLSAKYLGKPYPFRAPGEARLLVKIVPERVGTFG